MEDGRNHSCPTLPSLLFGDSLFRWSYPVDVESSSYRWIYCRRECNAHGSVLYGIHGPICFLPLIAIPNSNLEARLLLPSLCPLDLPLNLPSLRFQGRCDLHGKDPVLEAQHGSARQ